MSQGKGSMYGCVFFGSPSSPPRDKSDAVGCMHREENHSRLMTEMNNMSQEPETVKMTLEILKKARFPKVDQQDIIQAAKLHGKEESKNSLSQRTIPSRRRTIQKSKKQALWGVPIPSSTKTESNLFTFMDMYLDTMDCEAKTAILGLKGRQLVL
eukprot:CAMPEP_0202483072 /NCGR_PEP_ID=MMETSP1361-20130828/2389_1 /ASSEMBLY_ACC=CAM_ASM_000849 /TAXON_ID=210615 /ORGANISM="Staurosira complex sp., Strain CCMP2646" /LENGTH=154 /DNA_ID=CAMNT_0049111199 /DNA_START=704 /DNA_END=1169 /DNA_ORIENTATION=-